MLNDVYKLRSAGNKTKFKYCGVAMSFILRAISTKIVPRIENSVAILFDVFHPDDNIFLNSFK